MAALSTSARRPACSRRSSSNAPPLVPAIAAHFARQHGLSSREATVLQLAAGGIHRKETAARLGCGIATVDTYWRRILRKTRLTSQVEVLAALLCFALDVLDADERALLTRRLHGLGDR